MRRKHLQISLAGIFGLTTLVAIGIALFFGVFNPCDEWWFGQSADEMKAFVSRQIRHAEAVELALTVPNTYPGESYELQSNLRLAREQAGMLLQQLPNDFDVLETPFGRSRDVPAYDGKTIRVTVWPERQFRTKPISFTVTRDGQIFFHCFGRNDRENFGKINRAFYWTLELFAVPPAPAAWRPLE